MKRSMRQLAGTVLVLLLGGPPVSAGTEPCSGCTLLGSLSVQLTSVEPAAPMVGDEVTFTFAVASQLPSFFDCPLNGSCTFIGGEPFLDGNTPPTFGIGGVTVRRSAAQAGVATVELELRGETEEACRFEDESGCSTFFRPAFIDASTGPLALTVLEAPTPTPTPTFTPTPRRPTTDDDGCAITPAREASLTGFITLLLLPALLLAGLLLAGRTSASARKGR